MKLRNCGLGKINILLIGFACAAMSALSAQEAKAFDRAKAEGLIPLRSSFSLNSGWLNDGGAGNGWGLIIRSKSFIGMTPLYYGIGSTLGSFVSTGESIFETSGFFGYEAPIAQGPLGLDACLNIIVTGGRVDSSLHYRAESPALQPILALSFPAAADMDLSLFAAPVLRPYDLGSGTWGLSRSYLLAGIAFQAKTFLMTRKLAWLESLGN